MPTIRHLTGSAVCERCGAETEFSIPVIALDRVFAAIVSQLTYWHGHVYCKKCERIVREGLDQFLPEG